MVVHVTDATMKNKKPLLLRAPSAEQLLTMLEREIELETITKPWQRLLQRRRAL